MRTKLNRRACVSNQCIAGTQGSKAHIRKNEIWPSGRARPCLVGLLKEPDIYPKSCRYSLLKDLSKGVK